MKRGKINAQGVNILTRSTEILYIHASGPTLSGSLSKIENAGKEEKEYLILVENFLTLKRYKYSK